MRDDQGIYIGAHMCSNWCGVKSTHDEDCCGGRKVKKACIECNIYGVVKAEVQCNVGCKDIHEVTVKV